MGHIKLFDKKSVEVITDSVLVMTINQEGIPCRQGPSMLHSCHCLAAYHAYCSYQMFDVDHRKKIRRSSQEEKGGLDIHLEASVHHLHFMATLFKLCPVRAFVLPEELASIAAGDTILLSTWN